MSHQASHDYQATAQAMKGLPKVSLSRRRKQIQAIWRAIVSEFHPEKIILFGSYAYGKPDMDSDVDLLVVMPYEGSPFRQASLILTHIIDSVGVLPIDVIVRTKEQISQRVQIGDNFIGEILERGKVLYESDRA